MKSFIFSIVIAGLMAWWCSTAPGPLGFWFYMCFWGGFFLCLRWLLTAKLPRRPRGTDPDTIEAVELVKKHPKRFTWRERSRIRNRAYDEDQEAREQHEEQTARAIMRAKGLVRT